MLQHKTNFFLLTLCLSCLVVPSILFATTFEGKVVNVLSGDTLIISIGGKEYKTALANIATPLQGQNFHDEAKQFVEKLALNQKVTFSTKADMALNPETISAEVFVPKKQDPINRELIRAGLAWGKNENGEKNPYFATLKLAQNKRLGIWSETNPQPPWEFRKEQVEQKRIAHEQAKQKEQARLDALQLNQFAAQGKLPEVSEEFKKAQNQKPKTDDDKGNRKRSSRGSVNDIELFTIYSKLTGDEIEVSFTYKNRTTGHVFWEDESLDCKCEFKSGIVEDTKTLTLNNHNQNLYLKVDWSEIKRQATKFDAGRVTCSINVNGNKLETTDTVYLRY